MMESDGNCVLCGLEVGHHMLTEELAKQRPALVDYIRRHALVKVTFNNARSVCNKCWQKVQTDAESTPRETGSANPSPSGSAAAPKPLSSLAKLAGVSEYMKIDNHKRAPDDPKHCVFRNCPNTPLLEVPELIKLNLIFRNFFIPSNAKTCEPHLYGGEWEGLEHMCDATDEFTPEQCKDMINIIRRAFISGIRPDPNVLKDYKDFSARSLPRTRE